MGLYKFTANPILLTLHRVTVTANEREPHHIRLTFRLLLCNEMINHSVTLFTGTTLVYTLIPSPWTTAYKGTRTGFPTSFALLPFLSHPFSTEQNPQKANLVTSLSLFKSFMAPQWLIIKRKLLSIEYKFLNDFTSAYRIPHQALFSPSLTQKIQPQWPSISKAFTRYSFFQENSLPSTFSNKDSFFRYLDLTSSERPPWSPFSQSILDNH